MGIFSRLFDSPERINRLVEEARSFRNQEQVKTDDVFRIGKALLAHLKNGCEPRSKYAAYEIMAIVDAFADISLESGFSTYVPDHLKYRFKTI